MRALVLAVMILAGCASSRVASVDGGDDDDGGPDATAIDAGIDAVPCANSPCDIYDQCGCSGSASVCDLDPQMLASGATACRSPGTGGEATLCARSNECAAGHSCVGGHCRRYCEDDATCPGDGGLCILEVTTGSTTIPGVTMCTTDCVPTQATNAACPPTWACHVYFDQPGNRYLTDCSPPPTGAGGIAGAACTRNEDCRPGLDCINLTPGGMQCRPSCLCMGTNCGAGACPSGTGSCQGFTTPVVIGTATYGTCVN